MHNLPQELFELILDQLSGDPISVKTCSLVCRQWVRPTRDRAFHSLTIPIGLGASTNRREWHWRYEVAMYILFSPFSTLFPSVQTLTLQALLEYRYTTYTSSKGMDPDDALILKYFTNLRQLRIRQLPIPYPKTRDVSLSNEDVPLPLPIYDPTAITSLTLNRVGFETFSQLHRFVLSFPNLQHFSYVPSILPCDHWRLTTPSPMTLFLPVLPRSLNIALRDSVLDETLSTWTSGDASRLETLEISRIVLGEWKNCGKRLRPFLQRHTSVRALTLRFGVGRIHLFNDPEPYTHPLPEAEAPLTFHRLHQVELSCFYVQSSAWTIFKVLFYSLAEITSAMHTLRTVRLVFNCLSKPAFSHETLGRVGEILERFVHLGCVEVRVRSVKSSAVLGEAEEEMVVETVRSFLALFARRGVLKVTVEYVGALPFDSE